MNTLLWAAQILLAGLFIVAGYRNIFVHRSQMKEVRTGLPTTGATVTATLYSLIGNTWHSNDHTMTVCIW